MDPFSKYRVVVIGDAMLDQYIYGDVDRISPEAPIPILNKTKSIAKPGGSANVAVNLSSLGAQTILISVIGEDVAGSELGNLLEQAEIEFIPLKVKNRPTTKKTRIVSRGQQIIRIDEEVKDDISTAEESEVLKKITECISAKKIDALILQDYNKGMLTPVLVKQILALCKIQNILTVVDPKFEALSAYAGCSVFKPNLLELETAVGRKVQANEEDLKNAVQVLKTIVDFEKCYVTLGKYGIYNHQLKQIFEVVPNDVVDVTGAGDSVLSVLTLSSIQGASEAEITKKMNEAGQIACMHEGSYSLQISDFP